jgi:hypothetical protein
LDQLSQMLVRLLLCASLVLARDSVNIVQLKLAGEIPQERVDEIIQAAAEHVRRENSYVTKKKYVPEQENDMATDQMATADRATRAATEYDETCRIADCSRDESKCNNDYANTTSQVEVCCTANMFEMMRTISSFLDEHLELYSLVHGTLLGARRNGSIIPWTSDLDLLLTKSGLDLLLETFKAGTESMPYKFFRDSRVGMVRGCEDRPGLRAKQWDPGAPWYMDIYPGTLMSISSSHVKTSCCNCLGNLTTVDVFGQSFKALHNFDACLEEWYGSDWITPDSTKNRHGSR